MFGANRLAKNADINKYGCSGYGIGFDRRGRFSFPGRGFGINVKIFVANISTSVEFDNKKGHFNSSKKSIRRIRTYTTAEKMYSATFTVTRKKFCLSLHYNGANSIYLLMGLKLLNSEQKILRLQLLHYV